MAVTELLVLVTLLSHLAGCAHAFCWKPNLNPFMGTSHLKTLDNIIWFEHWIKSQRCPGYGTGRLVNCASQLGRRLPKGRCLWRGFPLRKSSQWFLSRENYHNNHFFSMLRLGWLSDQVSPPRCPVQLQTLRPHTQGLVLLILSEKNNLRRM